MRLARRALLQFAASAAILPASSRFSFGQSYPAKPVRIVVGFSAGGTTDVGARLIAQWLSDRLGQPFIVENKPGAGTHLATETVARAPADVTVIDRHNHHTFQPLLYQVATAALSSPDIAWPIRSILRRQENARVMLAEVTGIDTDRRRVRAGRLEIPYDYLVLATGVTHSYFGHDEWAPVAPGLKTVDDALEIRRRILLAFERAELTTDEAERKRLLAFVIGLLGAFLATLHLGHEIRDPEIGVFRSRFSAGRLRELGADRRREWGGGPPPAAGPAR